MALLRSKFINGALRVPTPCKAGEVVCQRFYYDALATLALNDIIEMGVLPQWCVPVDAVLETDDLDTNATPLIALDVGIMSGNVGEDLNPDNSARTSGNELFAADTVARAGGVSGPTAVGAFRIAAAEGNRSIGVKVQAAAATAAAGRIGLVLYYVDGRD